MHACMLGPIFPQLLTAQRKNSRHLVLIKNGQAYLPMMGNAQVGLGKHNKKQGFQQAEASDMLVRVPGPSTFGRHCT